MKDVLFLIGMVMLCIHQQKNLNIRKGPGTNYDKIGKHTGIGVFTIVAESEGEGATKWGLLKSYTDERNGWISLDFATKL